MAIVLALVAAAAYGTSDFLAGLMSRRASVFMVTAVAQGADMLVVGVALAFTGGIADGASLLWGGVAGLGSAGGALFLYRGLARGSMSIVGPVSAVVTAAASALAGVGFGDRPGPVTTGGVVVACVAVSLVALTGPTRVPAREAWRALLNATAAGIGFAILFVGLNRASADAGLWPVAAATVSALLLALVGLGIALLRGHERVASIRGVLPGGAATGVLGGGATVAYFVSTHQGLLTVTAVITSLYPAATVLLALGFLHERLHRVQVAGIALIAVAVALMAAAQH